jgi:endonuclease YncB( thermonuclease family)
LALIGSAAFLYVAIESAGIDILRSGPDIFGAVRVIDGDTIDVNGTRIRFHGIDAPEGRQSCRIEGVMQRCGDLATQALANKVGNRAVVCVPKDRDRYGRVVAVCRADGENLNAWMVANGWAMAYRHYSYSYVPQEIAARMAKHGIWQGDFIAPWNWRRGERL